MLDTLRGALRRFSPRALARPAAPTSEIGYAGGSVGGWWDESQFESTPELWWPHNVRVYDRMRRQDAQVASVLRAVTLPVRRTPWRIDPAGARPEVVQLVAEDLGLPVVGQPEQAPARARDRFSWPQHLQESLLALAFGHMPFEQTYRIDEQGRARLRKLGPRMPRTLMAINVAPDGGLISIEQALATKPIPVSRLVMYVHDREGGDWHGQSLLRPAYKFWLLKDRLLRVQAQTIERNGMGVPLYKAGPNESDLTAGQRLAQDWRSGDAAGAAVPDGADLVLRGVEGTLPDAEPVIRYYDEQIARAVLAHFLNLGTQTGSWALGSTFADFFTLSLQTVAEAHRDIAQQHIVEDLVDANWGPGEPAPRLVFDEIGSRQGLTAQAVQQLIQAGALSWDPELEQYLRQLYGLPARDPNAPPPQPPPRLVLPGTSSQGGAAT